MKLLAFPFLTLLLTAASALAQQKTVTIGVVNNPDMIELKKLSPKFEEKNPDIKQLGDRRGKCAAPASPLNPSSFASVSA